MALEELIKELETIVNNSEQLESRLILFNDEINTFDFVVESLTHICRHTEEQAFQCALIAHCKGKSIAKSGSRQSLQPMKNALQYRNLTVEII